MHHPDLLTTGNHNQTTFDHPPSSSEKKEIRSETQTPKTPPNGTRYGANEGCSEKNAGNGFY